MDSLHQRTEPAQQPAAVLAAVLVAVLVAQLVAGLAYGSYDCLRQGVPVQKRQ